MCENYNYLLFFLFYEKKIITHLNYKLIKTTLIKCNDKGALIKHMYFFNFRYIFN